MASDQYAALHAAYRWDVPAAFNIGAACCGRWASDRARFALYWEDESGECAAYTFWDLEQRANRLANALTALGVCRGDRVALILPQRMETVVAHIAVYRLGRGRGAAVVPVRPGGARFPAAEFARQGGVRRPAVAAERRRGARRMPGPHRRDRRRRRARNRRHAIRHAAGARRVAFHARRDGSRAIPQSLSTRAAPRARRKAR